MQLAKTIIVSVTDVTAPSSSEFSATSKLKWPKFIETERKFVFIKIIILIIDYNQFVTKIRTKLMILF